MQFLIFLEDMIDLRENLAAIESRLLDELYYLKLMIQDLLPRNSYYNQPKQSYYYDNNQRHSFNAPSYRPQPNAAPQPVKNYFQQIFPENSNDRYDYQERNSDRNGITQKPVQNFSTKALPPKQPEVVMRLKSLETNKSTKTVLSTSPAPTTTTADPPPAKNEYTYYWKLENFPKIFTHAKKNEVFSHVFNVKGLFLRIRAMLRHLDDQNLILDIEHLANIENVDKMEVEISDGLVFQEIAEEKLFQYSFAILDQSRPNHDLISPIYWNTETDNFLVPNSIHLLANYIKNEALLIKLIIIF